MSSWIEGFPTTPGIYWVVWEDHSGRRQVFLMVVQERAARESLDSHPRLEPDGDVEAFFCACDTWRAECVKPHYVGPEGWEEGWKWMLIPPSDKPWRVTHHQPIPRPAPPETP